MSFSNSFENAVLDAMLGGSASLLGGSVDIALSTTNPGEDGTGITEPGAGYTRVTINNDGAEWGAAVGGVKSNTNVITFPQASGGNWGLISHWALYESGIMRLYGEIDDGLGVPTPRQVNDGDTFKFLAGKLRISLD